MKKQVLILIFGGLFNSVIAQQTNINRTAAEFDKILSAQFKPTETGATVLIAQNGKVIYKKAFGMANLELSVPMHVNNIFRIGSITKQFTAVAILQLMEQGKLNLQDEITKFIPEYPTQGFKITIEHLLTHTSGIRNYAAMKQEGQRGNLDFKPAEMIDFFKNEPIRFTPGTKWEYSNSGYFLLGYIIEKITGKTYGEYIEENIFKPAGMSHSLYANDIKLVRNRAAGYSKSESGFENTTYLSMTQPYAAGSLQSTVDDLFKWQQALLNNKLLKKETLVKAFTRYKLADGKETNYGYGWRLGYVQGSPSLWHGGMINGFIAMAMYLPREDVFVAVFSNCDCNSPEDITAKLAAIAIGKPYANKAITAPNQLLAAYAGVYENGKGQQRIITVAENKLYAQLGRGPKNQIKAYQKDHFFFDEYTLAAIEFERNKSGVVEQLLFKSREANEVWVKVNKPVPSADGIKVDAKILESYTGVYELTPEFSFTVNRENERLFVQATGQEKFEIFAETETKFFTKVNDAELEFQADSSGKITKVILKQGGRNAEAKKIK